MSVQIPGNYSQDFRELHELLTFGFAFQDAIVRALGDGKVDFSDIGLLWPVVTAARDAFNNLGNPIERFRALPENEKIVLFEWARIRFDLPDEVLESLIEDTIEEIIGDISVAQRWAKYLKPKTEQV